MLKSKFFTPFHNQFNESTLFLFSPFNSFAIGTKAPVYKLLLLKINTNCDLKQFDVIYYNQNEIDVQKITRKKKNFMSHELAAQEIGTEIQRQQNEQVRWLWNSLQNCIHRLRRDAFNSSWTRRERVHYNEPLKIEISVNAFIYGLTVFVIVCAVSVSEKWWQLNGFYRCTGFRAVVLW